MRGVSLVCLFALGMLLGSLTPATVLDSVDARLQLDAGRVLAAQLPVEGSAATKRLAETSRHAEFASGGKLADRSVAGTTTSTSDLRALAQRSREAAEAETLPAHSHTQGPRAPPAPPRP